MWGNRYCTYASKGVEGSNKCGDSYIIRWLSFTSCSLLTSVTKTVIGARPCSMVVTSVQDLDAKRTAGLASAVYYYFDFRDASKQHRQGLLSSLLVQLGAESDSCHKILSRLYMAHDRGGRKLTDIALMHCLKDMPEHHQQATYIHIDAIDECPNTFGFPTPREKVLEFLERLIDWQDPHLRICIASRPEVDIRKTLEPLTSLRVSLPPRKKRFASESKLAVICVRVL